MVSSPGNPSRQCLSVCLPVCLSLPAPIWLPRKASHMVSSPGIACRQCLSVCLCFCLCLPAYLPACLRACLPIALPMCLCIYLYTCLSASATHRGGTCCTPDIDTLHMNQSRLLQLPVKPMSADLKHAMQQVRSKSPQEVCM